MRQRGFTLIEVVVAMAVVALGMAAVFRVVQDTINNSTYLRDRTLATWIADNRVTELRLSREMPSVDETDGSVDFANQKWHWTATVSQTPVDDLRRIDVRVRRETDADGSSLAQVTGFVGAIALGTPPSPTPWNGAPGDGDPQGAPGPDGDSPNPADRNDRPAPGSEPEE